MREEKMSSLLHQYEFARQMYPEFKWGPAPLSHQVTAFNQVLDHLEKDPSSETFRWMLFFRTGAAKTATALMIMRLHDVTDVLIVAPPDVHEDFAKVATAFGITATTVSHAKFRMKDYAVSRTRAIIVDEFHLLGGRTAAGWKKVHAVHKGLKAPMVIMSAHPNYNDPERVYCAAAIIDPPLIKGGFLQFLADHCVTELNPFSAIPLFKSFRNHASHIDFLNALPCTSYVADDVDFEIIDLRIPVPVTSRPIQILLRYGVYQHTVYKPRVCASLKEREIAIEKSLYCPSLNNVALGSQRRRLRSRILSEIKLLIENSSTPVIIYARTSTIAKLIVENLKLQDPYQLRPVMYIDGKTPKKTRKDILKRFKQGHVGVLVCTAAIVTGTDGLDKVCDTLILAQDTDDNVLRRQLIGRILPRGTDTDASAKKIYRIVPFYT